jgi:hypothetical protein
LINLGFEWLIEGDANRNASVDVSYRKAGETAWKKGMPLLRLYDLKDLDFRLKPGSAGALEADQPLPTYGPRP